MFRSQRKGFSSPAHEVSDGGKSDKTERIKELQCALQEKMEEVERLQTKIEVLTSSLSQVENVELVLKQLKYLP